MGKMSDVQIFWSLCAECVEFLSQMRSGAVLIESRHGEGQTDKQGLYQRKRSDRVLTTYIRYSNSKQTEEREKKVQQYFFDITIDNNAKPCVKKKSIP